MTTNPITSPAPKDGAPVKISLSRFADFCVSDPSAQFSKVLEIKRQYDRDFTPSAFFWSRWIEAVTEIHQAGGHRDALGVVAKNALHNRGGQYESAAAGYAKFWANHDIELVHQPASVIWEAGRLHVSVNPEWLLRIDGKLTIVKLHLKQKLELNQRLANPILRLLEMHFATDEIGVMVLDVHRGKPYAPKRSTRRMDSVLLMQASSFVTGWDACQRGVA